MHAMPLSCVVSESCAAGTAAQLVWLCHTGQLELLKTWFSLGVEPLCLHVP